MENLIMTAAPHIHAKDSSRRIMLDVILALLPVTVAAIVIFGGRAAAVIAVCVVSCVLSEAVFNLLVRKKQTVGDLSAALTGLLLGLNLSATVPLWQCAVGSVFAIVMVKCLFGGLGHNFANPAITGRVFMLLTFSAVAGGAMPAVVELTASATPLEALSTGGELPTLLQMFLGLRGGAVGEGCIAALLLGYVYLVARRVIKWYVPAIFMGTVFACYLVATGDPSFALYVTTPITNGGKMLFALGCGLITFVIRYFCAYPEGVSFSILAMNILSPLLEKWTAKKPLGGS